MHDDTQPLTRLQPPELPPDRYKPLVPYARRTAFVLAGVFCLGAVGVGVADLVSDERPTVASSVLRTPRLPSDHSTGGLLSVELDQPSQPPLAQMPDAPVRPLRTLVAASDPPRKQVGTPGSSQRATTTREPVVAPETVEPKREEAVERKRNDDDGADQKRERTSKSSGGDKADKPDQEEIKSQPSELCVGPLCVETGGSR